MTYSFIDRDDLSPVVRCALHLISAGCAINDHEPFNDYAAFERIMWHDDETMHAFGLERTAYKLALSYAWDAIEQGVKTGCDARFYTPPFWATEKPPEEPFSFEAPETDDGAESLPGLPL